MTFSQNDRLFQLSQPTMPHEQNPTYRKTEETEKKTEGVKVRVCLLAERFAFIRLPN